MSEKVHPWCSDPARDEAVRAAEDGRLGPLPTLEQCIERARAMMAKELSGSSAVEQENKATGMRTERVTLEITMRAESYAPCRDLDWQRMLRQTPGGLFPDESVRVVEECCLDRINMGEVIRERDAAIRERQKAEQRADRDFVKCSALADKVIELCARVAELEAARAASGAANSPKSPVSSEPVAWGVLIDSGRGLYGHYDFEAEARGVCDAVNAEEGWAMTVVPLYAAPVAESATTPQPPRGWLTENERGALTRAFDLLCDDDGDQPLAGTVQRLLARLTPPRVKRPKYFPMSWAHERDDAWIAAIREAGVEVGG